MVRARTRKRVHEREDAQETSPVMYSANTVEFPVLKDDPVPIPEESVVHVPPESSVPYPQPYSRQHKESIATDQSVPRDTNKTARSRRRTTRVIVVLVICAIIVCGLLIGAGMFVWRTMRPVSEQERALRTVAEVSELIELPTDETPSVATVKNATELQNTAFFARAQDGDVVIAYSHAHIAILYRPSIHKIIAVTPLNARDGIRQESAGRR